jgi:hypothetical protein
MRAFLIVSTSIALTACCPGLDASASGSAGGDAIACGTPAFGSDLEPATTCALSADQSGHAFWVRFFARGIDSDVRRAFARSPSGELYRFDWDGDPSGGSHAPPHMTRTRCVGPLVRGPGTDGVPVACELSTELETICQ